MHPTVYAFGEKVEDVTSCPVFKPTLNAIALTYSLAQKPENEWMTVTSPYANDKINRFLHICESTDDLVKRAEMSKYLTPFHGACVGARCVGTGALNTLFATTYDIDKKHGTDYHERFKKFLAHVQTEDLVCSGMVTDAKGDRSLRPALQADPDVYLHIVERREDGIVVSGAKAHQSGAVLAHYNIIVPTTGMKEDEKDFSIAFAVPADAPGITHIAEAPAPNARRLTDADPMDFGNAAYGVHAATLVVFDNVFIPNEHIFMCGEYEFAGKMAVNFGRFQRMHTSACKSGHVNLTMGAVAVLADYNGCSKMSHIKEKLIDMTFSSALTYGTCLASAYKGVPMEAGDYFPDNLMVNAAKLQCVKAVWEACQLASEIAGGIISTAPCEKDFANPDIAEYVDKYFHGVDNVPTKDRVRITRLLEYLVGQGSIIPTESTHGGGPAAIQRLSMRLAGDWDYYKEKAKAMAGIKD